MRLLDGRVALVTGGASGIGRAGAELMAEAGAAVVVADINRPAGEAVADSIRQAGCRATSTYVDVRDSGAVQAMVAETVGAFGRIDVLFHNAMAVALVNQQDARLTELPEAIWDEIVRLVLTGTYLCVKYVGRQMVAQRSGSIVLTATVDALVGVTGIDAYTAAKGGVLALTRSLAVGLAPDGIRVNAICPGFVKTPGQMAFLDDPVERAKIEALHLLPIAEPRDIAQFALYLASDQARCMTGGVHVVDSGYTAFKAGAWLKDAMTGAGTSGAGGASSTGGIGAPPAPPRQ